MACKTAIEAAIEAAIETAIEAAKSKKKGWKHFFARKAQREDTEGTAISVRRGALSGAADERLRDYMRVIHIQCRRVYPAGVAKHSKMLSRQRPAMALEGVPVTDYPACVEIPPEVEERAYVWSEFARRDDCAGEGGGINEFVGGIDVLV